MWDVKAQPFLNFNGGLDDNIAYEIMDHYNDVIMGAIASQITGLTIVYSTVYSGVDQRKHESSASLAFVRVIHRRPVNSPHKWPVTRKMFPFDDVIMVNTYPCPNLSKTLSVLRVLYYSPGKRKNTCLQPNLLMVNCWKIFKKNEIFISLLNIERMHKQQTWKYPYTVIISAHRNVLGCLNPSYIKQMMISFIALDCTTPWNTCHSLSNDSN